MLDDQAQVVDNLTIRSLGNIPGFFLGGTFFGGGSLSAIYYKPILLIAYTLLHTFFGLIPFFFHIFQLIIFIINAILLFSIFRNFLGKYIAFISALIFLVHPLNAEIAFYTADLQEVMFMFFGLLSLRILIKAEKATGDLKIIFSKQTITRKTFHISLSSFFVLCSLLSKETGFLFIIIDIAYVFFFSRKLMVQVGTVLSGSFLIYLFLRFAIAKSPLLTEPMVPIMAATLPERLINIPAMSAYYIQNFFFPKNLIYGQAWIINTINFADFIYPLIIITIFAITFAIIFSLILKGTNYFKTYIFFSLWFVIGLGLHLQLIPLDATVNDRWLYFPMIGLIAVLSVVVSYFIQKKKYRHIPEILAVGALALVVGLAIRTYIRTMDYSNQLTLVKHDLSLSKRPEPLLEGFLGTYLAMDGKLEEGEMHLKKSLQIFPPQSVLWNNLGSTYIKMGDMEKAKDSYAKSIEYGHFYAAYENMSNILVREDSEQAAKFTEDALEIFPNDVILWQNLMYAQSALGKYSEAVRSAWIWYKLTGSQQALSNYYMLVQNKPLDTNFKPLR